MEPVQTPITGNEAFSGLLSPFDALVHFYHAFNNRDILGIAQNWAQDGDIAMDILWAVSKEGGMRLALCTKDYSRDQLKSTLSTMITHFMKQKVYSTRWAASAEAFNVEIASCSLPFGQRGSSEKLEASGNRYITTVQ